MEKNKTIIISAVSNGFMVTPELKINEGLSKEELSVFQSMGELEKFLRDHFSFRRCDDLIVDDFIEG